MTDDQMIDMQKSINQINDILNLLDDAASEKVPESIKKFFNIHYDETIEYIKIKPGVSLIEQQMEKYTAPILTHIVDKYIRGK